MLTFAGLLVPGTHGPVITEPPDYHGRITHYSGVIGESQLLLGRGGRNLRVEIVLHSPSFTSADVLAANLDIIDQYSQTLVGVLQETGTVTRTFPNCTFRGFQIDENGMKPDIAGTLSGTGTWWCRGVLSFRQMGYS